MRDVYISKVTSRGQVTLPPEWRAMEKVGGKDYVVMRQVGQAIVLERVVQRLERLDEITRLFEADAKRRGITKQDVLDALDRVRGKAKAR